MAAASIDHIPLDIELDDDEALDQYLDYADLDFIHRQPLSNPFETVLVIDGAPIVDESKRDKLFSVIRKQFSKEGVKVKDNGLHMPMEEVKGKLMSKGFLFVDFDTPADAQKALNDLQFFKFDRGHTFFLNRFEDIEKYSTVPDEWDEIAAVGPAPEYKEQGFLHDWLLDSNARDQIAVFNDRVTSIMWFNKDKSPEVIHEHVDWTDGYVAWSPRGSYLASVHRAGIAIWGTKDMNRLQRFYHPGVRFLDFSPLENYIVTFSPEPIAPVAPGDTSKPWGPESAGHHVCVWNVRNGRLLRSFPLTQEEIATKNIPWPLFKWSWDEKFVARIVSNAKITVYETPSLVLLDKKSISLPGVTEFEWMPYTPDEETDNPSNTTEGKKASQKKQGPHHKRNIAPPHVIAYFVPQRGADNPAQLALMSIHNRQIIRQKQVFFGLVAKIHFQPQGDYLLFKVDRTNRSGKANFVSLEVFRLREKDFPADSVEFQQIITAFSWEPAGNRFAVITTLDTPSPDLDIKAVMAGAPGKMTAHIYEVEAAVETRGKNAGVPGGVKLIKELDRKSVNSVFWSPKGRYVVFAGLRNLQGILEFFDVDAGADGSKDGAVTTTTIVNGKEVTSVKNVERMALLASNEHHGATDAAWDPTGRYFMTSVTMWGKSADHGFHIWDLRGSLLTKQPREQLKQALWRPRPPTLLSKSKLKYIRKNIKNYAREFEIQDAQESSALSQAELEERKRLFEEWYRFRSNALMAMDAIEKTVTIIEI